MIFLRPTADKYRSFRVLFPLRNLLLDIRNGFHFPQTQISLTKFFRSEKSIPSQISTLESKSASEQEAWRYSGYRRWMRTEKKVRYSVCHKFEYFSSLYRARKSVNVNMSIRSTVYLSFGKYIIAGLHVRKVCSFLYDHTFERHQVYKCWSGSSVGIATDYGLDGAGIESRWGARFSALFQNGPGAHPASCTMGTVSFPGVKSGRGVTLTPHHLLVPWP